MRTLTYNRTSVGTALDERIERTAYDPLGRIASRIDARLFTAGAAPNFSYVTALSGQLLRSAGVDAGAQLTLADLDGRPVWSRDARGTVSTWTYDTLGRPLTAIETLAGGAPAVRDAWIYGETEPNPAAHNLRGQCVRHYDPAGRLAWTGFRLTGQPLNEARTLLADPDTAPAWSGDESAWAAALETVAYSTTWRHDATGAWFVQTDAKGNVQTQAVDVAGRLAASALTLAGGSARPVLAAIDYSAAGQILTETAGNGVISAYGYEPQTQRLMRLTVTRLARPGRPAVLQDLHYAYDPVGNVLSARDAARATTYWRNQRVEPVSTYTYDALYQVLSATGREMVSRGRQVTLLPPATVPLPSDDTVYVHYRRTYTYDRGGNLTQIAHQGEAAYTQDIIVSATSNHALAQNNHGSLTPADVDDGTWFDAAGNQQSLLPDRAQPLAWNGRNRLATVTLVQRDSQSDRETYQYGADGMRVRKLTATQTSGTTRTVETIYLPGLTLRVTRSDDGKTMKVVAALQEVPATAARTHVRALHWETGLPAGLANDALRFSHGDLIGSTGLELDGNAEMISREEYYPYGGTAVWCARSQAEADTKYRRYSCKERDVTGLYDYGWRSYQPWLGRWLNPDPAGTVDGLNVYCMVNGNPILQKDSDGRMKSIAKLLQIDETARLGKGHISVLANKGLFVGDGEVETDLQFLVHRYDSVVAMDNSIPFENNLTHEGGYLRGALSVFNGAQATSSESGSGIIGTYWGNNKLGANITGINVVNGMSGTVGIKIPFGSIQWGRPIIITSGALSGCTMIYSVKDSDFYAFHTGQKPGDDWKTGNQGVITTYESYKILSGTDIYGPINRHNDELVRMFAQQDKSTITYLGKDGVHITYNSEFDNVSVFDYNKVSTPKFAIRAGYSYALLVRGEAGVKIKTLSEDVVVSQRDFSITKISSFKNRLT
ncbi:hypothetical protein WJ88_25060 [Burkholderia ubonensis]|nr:hypothetical protein WJ88_25060 [Burkholderia ubonensis]